jgi:8-oxo-dGTP pyrophosphatase MutT (NUDIX family)
MDVSIAPPGLSADVGDFLARARSRLLTAAPSFESAADPLAGAGDHNLAPGLISIDGASRARPAAVLVPIVAHPDGATVLLTQRTADLPTHAGQIAFPGGRVDATDASPLAAALREADEEIGLARDRIEPLGYLDTYLSGTGFRIVPVVALVRPPFALAINQREVDEAFEVPLAFLMSPENHQKHSRELRGVLRHFYAMPFGERFIWGVTAGILRRLWERVYA